MAEPSTQASLQRRANWVGFRTLRQRPKLVGATTEGEPVYEIRSVRLVLRGLSPHFDRLAPCARCGKELPAAPVLTVADLERPLRPVICTDCVRGTGVSSAQDLAAGRLPALGAVEAAAAPAPEHAEPVEPAPAPAGATAAGEEESRIETFEGHLRVVTGRVNELGKALWAERDQRRRGEEATRSALAGLGEQVSAVSGVGDRVDAQRAELAAVLSAVTEIPAELQRLADANRELVRSHQDLDRRLGEGAGPAAVPPDEMTALVAAQRQLERRVAEAEARPAGGPAPAEGSEIERVVASRLVEVEGRLGDQVAGQWGDLEAALEASVRIYGTGFARAHEELAASQSGLVRQLDTLASQLAQATGRMDALASWMVATNNRLDALEERAERALLAGGLRLEVPRWEAPAGPSGAESGGLVETLERQLHDAASRLAARTNRVPGESLVEGSEDRSDPLRGG